MSWLSKTIRRNKNSLVKIAGVVTAATGVGALASAAIVAGSKAALSATTKPKTATPAKSATQAVQTSATAASPASPAGVLSGNASMIALLLVGGMILFLMVGVKR